MRVTGTPGTGGQSVELDGPIPAPILAGYPDERKQDNPRLAFLNELSQAVVDTIPEVEDVESGTIVGVVQWPGGQGWRFDRHDRFDRPPAEETPESQVREVQESLQEEAADHGAQVGFDTVIGETGTTERFERPGEEFVAEFVHGPESVTTPTELNGWEHVEEEFSNALDSWKAGRRPVFLRLYHQTGMRSGFRLGLEDARISGMSGVGPISRSPTDVNEYDTLGAAYTAAIRWMASHPAATTDHPFMDSRITDPPEGWDLDTWSLHSRKETIEYRPRSRTDPWSSFRIHIEGFHSSDRYQLTQMQTGLNAPKWEGAGSYPERGQELPRNRMLNEATQFMEANAPDPDDFARLTDRPFDADEEARIRHHALRDNLRTMFPTGQVPRTVERTLLAEFDAVDEYIDFYEQGGEFTEFEGVGPAVAEVLEAVAEVAIDAMNEPVPDYDEGDVVDSRTGIRYRIEEINEEGTVRRGGPHLILRRIDISDGGTERQSVEDFEKSLRADQARLVSVDDDETASAAVCDAFLGRLRVLLGADGFDQDTFLETLATAESRGCIAPGAAERFRNLIRGLEGSRFEAMSRRQAIGDLEDAFET